jgi:hypothetical protein
MSIKSNRKHILDKLKTKKKYHWFVQKATKGLEERTATRLRIQALVDKAFPELVGVKV